MSPRAQGIVIAFAAAPAFGMSAILAKFALADGASPLGILVTRFAIATALLAALIAAMRRPWPRGRALAKLLALGAAGQGAMAFCFFSALEHASAGLASLLLYLHPALIALSEVLLRWERMRPVKALAIAVATAGCALTVGGGSGSLLGVAWALGAAAALTFYMLALKRWVAGVDPYVSATVLIAGTFLAFLVMSLFRAPVLPTGAGGWAAIVALAIVATVLGKLLLLAAIARLPASDVSTLMTIEPVFTLAAGWLLLDETISLSQAGGAVLIVASVVVLARAASREPAPAAATRPSLRTP